MKGNHQVSKKAEAGGEEEAEAVRIWDCGSPLYDSYELVALSHVIERHFMVLPYLSGSRKAADHEACESSSSSLRSSSCKPDEASGRKSNARRSSVLSFLSDVVRKRKMDVERKEKAAKKQKTGISKIFQCRWKK